MRLFRFFIGFIMLSLLLVGEVMAADASGIMQTVFNARRVDDQIATLTFHFINPDEPERQAIYTMVWKDMRGKDGYDNKAIFFTESPLMRKGVAYLAWVADSRE